MFLNAATWPRHFLRDFPPRKTRSAQIHRTIDNILLPPTGWKLIPFNQPQRVYGWTEYADVTTKFSQIDRFSYPWCTAGARFARDSSAINRLIPPPFLAFPRQKMLQNAIAFLPVAPSWNRAFHLYNLSSYRPRVKLILTRQNVHVSKKIIQQNALKQLFLM